MSTRKGLLAGLVSVALFDQAPTARLRMAEAQAGTPQCAVEVLVIHRAEKTPSEN